MGNIPRWTIAIIAFVFGSIFSPIFERMGNEAWLRFFGPEAEIVICSPLISSRLIGRSGDRIVVDEITPAPNLTSVWFFNNTGTPLSNLKLLIYVASSGESQMEPIWATIATTSMTYADDFEVEYGSSQYLIQVERFNDDEAIIADILFDSPVGFIVEASADGFSLKRNSGPGCSEAARSENLSLPTVVYQFADPQRCAPTGECQISNRSAEFEITKEDSKHPFYLEPVLIYDE